MPTSRAFMVRLRTRDGRESAREILAETPHLAVHIAERVHDAKAVALTETRRVEGRCHSCGAILFEGDGRRRHYRGADRFYCVDCRCA